jgi:LmbE family N-acetylglucosaminyl deacetylase
MLEFTLPEAMSEGAIALFLGAHSDDIEIGCGGTILKLAEMYPNLYFYWVVLGSSGIRTEEALKSANLFLEGIDRKNIVVKNFQDGFFPYIGADVKGYFEQLKREINPDLIFTHYRHDLHQDHRLVCELTWNTFRNHLILEYEIPKYDGDLGSPNLFVPISEQICQRKIRILFTSFLSQTKKQWFTEDTFQAIMRLRSIESASAERFAEAFYCRKLLWTL